RLEQHWRIARPKSHRAQHIEGGQGVAVLRMVFADREFAVYERCVARMITVAIKNVWQSDHATSRCHSREQVLIFRSDSFLVVTTDRIKRFSTKHCRAVRKRNIAAATYQPPAIARTHHSPAGIDSIAEGSNN